MGVIELKGHSGCKIFLLENKNKFLVRKISGSPEYNSRLLGQIKKQRQFSHHLIKSPRVFGTFFKNKNLCFEMEFIRGQSLVNFVERENHENIKTVFLQIIDFISHNNWLEEDIKDDVEEKITDLHLSTKYQVFKDYCLDYDWQKINKSYSHGDLTFENIIIRDGEIFFIDFLDSFTSSRVLDYSKLMQDIASAWSWRENTQSPFINLLLLDNILKESVSTNILTASHKMLILNLLRIIPYSSKKEEEFLYTSLLKLKQQKI